MTNMTRASLVAFALVAGLVCVQAAGGIKGSRQLFENSQQRLQAGRGPASLRSPQQPLYLQPQQQQQPLALQPAAPLPQSNKAGLGQTAPVFNAVRVQPAPIPQQVQLQQAQVQEPEIQQQQQQQQEEIDPNAAAQEAGPSVLAPARAGPAASSEEEANPRPEPYAFQYAFNAADAATSGSSSREEQQDASGRVTGFYTLRGEDGRDRRVDYVADASGFKATVSTNELGTADKDSADVDWNAQNPSDGQLRAAEAATEAARQRALLNPQPIQQQPVASASSSSSQKFSSPRQRGGLAASSQQQASKINFQPQASKINTQQQQQQIQQLQEPFEQIRQTELNTRARRQSRHAPFYLFTV